MTDAASGWRRLFAAHEGKAALERWWLIYTLIWGPVTALVMVTGWARSWGDAACLVFGLLVFAGAVGPPLLWPHPSERKLRLRDRASVKLMLSVALFSFGLNYTQTPFFFDVLHMHYGFDVTWTIDRNPVFLYLVTVAYFGTYASLIPMAYRAVVQRSRLLAWLVVPMAVALLETLLNANPFMQQLYCFDDVGFGLWFGTLAYGFSFVVALPMWMRIDERPGASVTSEVTRKVTLWSVVVVCAAALFADWLYLEVLRHHIAPLFTTVVTDAPGLGDFAGSCLAR